MIKSDILIKEDEQKKSYRSIFKATSLFGGVQIYQILVNVIKSKIIAILLGPEGIGLIGLYQSVLELLKSFTSLGITQSGVRDVSEANESGDFSRISETVSVVKRLVWVTGMSGTIVVILLSPFLSSTTFGDKSYVLPLIVLSITLLIDQISNGQKVLLQGLRRLTNLAKATAIGATLGLLVSIPLYYFYGSKGIVPTLIFNSLSALLLSWYFSRRIKLMYVANSLRATIKKGRTIIIMGVAMSISGMLATFVSFILRSYIRREGSLEEVGLYQAGFLIITTYVGLVFNAIATDYYPRLASINTDNDKCKTIICQQGEIASFILTPLLCICLLFMPYVLQVLYSSEFLAANLYIKWACVGMMFRLAAWGVSYIFLAKAESKLFIINELVGNIYYLIMSIIGYKLWGMSGLGLAFCINYIIYLLQVYVIAHKRYNFSYSSTYIKCFVIQLLLVLLGFSNVLLNDDILMYLLGILIIMISCLYSFLGLNKRIHLFELFKSKLKL